MANNSDVLNMVRVELDTARVARQAGRLNLPVRYEDFGYLIHCFLSDLFGMGIIRPFRILSERTRRIAILGYARCDREGLQRHAIEFADPARYAACDWDTLAVKPMPNEWSPGRMVGFELRVCPVVRLTSDVRLLNGNGEACHYPAGAEIDAWEHRWFTAKGNRVKISREQTYAEWLKDRIDDAASLGMVRVQSFRRVHVARRDHGTPRKARVMERPEVILQGEMTIRDPIRFRSLLTSGIGRHRAFGFGMLLLRQAGSS